MADFPSYGTIPHGVIKLEIVGAQNLGIQAFGKFGKIENDPLPTKFRKPTDETTDQGRCRD